MSGSWASDAAGSILLCSSYLKKQFMLLSSLFLCIWKWNKQREISSRTLNFVGTIWNLFRCSVTQGEWKFSLADRQEIATNSHTRIAPISLSLLSLFLILQKSIVGYIRILSSPSLPFILRKTPEKKDMGGIVAGCSDKQRIFFFLHWT